MRLADVDALKQTFCAECDHSIKCEDCDIDYHFEHLAPTVDAVLVVRCKDCVYRYHDSKRGYMCYMDSSDPYEQTRGVDDGEWFCADGERRQDGNEPKSV